MPRGGRVLVDIAGFAIRSLVPYSTRPTAAHTCRPCYRLNTTQQVAPAASDQLERPMLQRHRQRRLFHSIQQNARVRMAWPTAF